MSSLVNGSKAKHPLARRAIYHVARMLRRNFRSDLWPRKFQLIAVAYCMVARDKAVISDVMGLGKQQPVDTRVATPHGWRQIGDIVPGDRVIGSDGRPTAVEAVYPQGVKPSYRLTFSDGSSVEAGPDHLWTIQHKKGGKVWEDLLLTTDQIRTRPTIPRERSNGQTAQLNLAKVHLYLPLVDGPIRYADRRLPIGSYVMGQLIANGCQRVPPDYLRAHVSARIDLFHGLMDARGSISKTRNKVTYCTTSEGLAQDVRELVEGLGGIASIRRYDRSAEGKPTDYQVRIRVPAGLRPFSVPWKADRYNPRCRSRPCRTVKSVEYVRDVESVCIRVAAPDGLYVTEHAILTHNTSEALLRIYFGQHPLTLLISPASVLLTWKAEAEKWLPGVPFHRLDKVAKPLPEPGWRGIIGTTWDLMPYHSRGLAKLKPSLMIGDESHMILNPKARRSRHFDWLCRKIPHRLLLTGTPLVNQAADLWRLLHLADPKLWPEDLLADFKDGDADAFEGHGSPIARRIRITMIRRTKETALKGELTAKTYRDLKVQLSPENQRRYDKVHEDFAAWLDRRIRRTVERDRRDLEAAAEAAETEFDFEAEVATRLERALRSPKLVQVTHLRHLVGQLKAPMAGDWAVQAARSGESVVVFADHTDVIARIARTCWRQGIAAGIIDGKTSKTRRFSRVKEFQEGKTPVLICSAAGETGLTLTRARHVLLAEWTWTDASMGQRADRVHRIGQKRDVTVWRLVALRTIDERMSAVTERKGRVARRTVDASAPGSPGSSGSGAGSARDSTAVDSS